MTGTGTQADPFVVNNWDDFATAIGTDGAWVELDNSSSNKVIDMSEHGFFNSGSSNVSAIPMLCKNINGNGWEIRSLSWNGGSLFGGSPSSTVIINDLYFTNFNSVCSSSSNQMFYMRTQNAELNDCRISGELENSSLFYCYKSPISLNRCSLNVNLKNSASINKDSYNAVDYINCNIKVTGNTNRDLFNYSTLSFCYIAGFLNFTSTTGTQFNLLGTNDFNNYMHTVVDINVNNTGISTNTIRIFNAGHKIVNTDKITGFATVSLTDETCAVTSAQLENENYLKSIGFAIGVEGG